MFFSTNEVWLKSFRVLTRIPLEGYVIFFVSPYWFLFGWWESILLWVVTDLWASRRVSATLLGIGIFRVHPRLDLVNMVVRPFLFTKLSLFTKSSLNKDWYEKRSWSLFIKSSISLNRGSLNRVSGICSTLEESREGTPPPLLLLHFAIVLPNDL